MDIAEIDPDRTIDRKAGLSGTMRTFLAWLWQDSRDATKA